MACVVQGNGRFCVEVRREAY